MTRKFRASGYWEEEVKSKWSRRYFTRYGRPGQARYGKNQIIRRSRRDSRLDIKSQIDSMESYERIWPL